MASGGAKQKLNTQSSTTLKLVLADEFLLKIVWVKKFLGRAGYYVEPKCLVPRQQKYDAT